MEPDYQYTLMWMPKSGLFFNGAEFVSGEGNTIRWSKVLHLYKSHTRAEMAKKRILAQFPEAQGELVSIRVKVEDVEG
jgi:hypothetical protein